MNKKQLVVGILGGLMVLTGAGCALNKQAEVNGRDGVKATLVMDDSGDQKEIENAGPVSVDQMAKIDKNSVLKLNLESSSVAWKADKAVGAGQSGTVKLSAGSIGVENGEVKSGSFTVDLKTIKDDKGNAQLEEHLKNADFFNVEKYPTASFVITSVYSNDVRAIAPPTRYMVKGDLTIKDKTMLIEFPAEITSAKGEYSASATFTIDRTKWGITYGSGTVFKNLGDKLIKDEIVFNLKLKTLVK